MHERGLVHRDVKLDNILLDHKGDVKLADFGLSRHMPRRDRSQSFCGSRYEFVVKILYSPIFRPYSAPEIVKELPYDPYIIDWYAAGVVLYTMITGEWPHVSFYYIGFLSLDIVNN